MKGMWRKTGSDTASHAYGAHRSLLILLVGAGLCLSSCIGHTRQELAAGCRDNNDSYDCLDLGYMLLRGQDGRKNPQEALEYFVRSCELGNSIGCKKAGKIWESGATGFKNPRKAEMYYRMAKELDANAIVVRVDSQ